MPTARRVAIAALGMASAWCPPRPALAAGGGQHPVVVVAEGPEADAVATNVAARLHDPYAARDAHDFRASFGAGPASLAAGLRSKHADAELVSRARAAAIDAHVDAAVLVHVRRAHRASTVHVWVVEASSGAGAAVDREITLGASASAADLTDAAWTAARDAFPTEPPATAPPPPPPSGPSSTPEAAAAPSPTTPPSLLTADGRATQPDSDATPGAGSSDSARSLLRMGVAIEAGSRHFAYVDRLTSTLRPYDLFAAPIVSLRVEAVPFARSTSPLIEGLGLSGEYARAFGISSGDSAGTAVETTWQAFHADLRENVAVTPAVRAGAHAGFGAIDFSLGDLGTGSELPSVGYRFVRAGVDGLLTLRDFSVYAEASYLAVLSTGAIGSLFPHESAGGIAASTGLLWPLAHHLDLGFELAYTRFFYSLHPEPGDPNVAGGALDEMARVALGVTYRL
jgi:hypothetical protein